jgi:hypothetical protein
MNSVSFLFSVTPRFNAMFIPDDLYNHAAISTNLSPFSKHQLNTIMPRNNVKIPHFADRSNGILRGVPLSPFEG